MRVTIGVGTAVLWTIGATASALAMKATITDVKNLSQEAPDAGGGPLDAYGLVVVLDSQDVPSPSTPNLLRLQISTVLPNPLFDTVNKNITVDPLFPHPPWARVVEAQMLSSTGFVPFGGTTTVGWNQTDLKPTDGTCQNPMSASLTARQICNYGRLIKMYWTGPDGLPSLGPKGSFSIVSATTGTYRTIVPGARPSAAIALASTDVTIAAGTIGLTALPPTSVVNPGDSVVLKYEIIGDDDLPIATAFFEDEPLPGTVPMNGSFAIVGPDDAPVKVRNAMFKIVNPPLPLEQLVSTTPALSSMSPLQIVPQGPAATTTFTIANNGMTDYSFSGLGLDPTLTLLRGRTYAFNVNAPGHPFFIATQGSNAAAPHFTDGVTNNDVTVGTLTFTVPATAPATLFYQCGIHNAMSGTLLIQDPPPVPALGTVAMFALAALVLGAGILARRRRIGL